VITEAATAAATVDVINFLKKTGTEGDRSLLFLLKGCSTPPKKTFPSDIFTGSIHALLFCRQNLLRICGIIENTYGMIGGVYFYMLTIAVYT
jgi:hypothetical protein